MTAARYFLGTKQLRTFIARTYYGNCTLYVVPVFYLDKAHKGCYKLSLAPQEGYRACLN